MIYLLLSIFFYSFDLSIASEEVFYTAYTQQESSPGIVLRDSRIPLESCILDVGCGDGKVTSEVIFPITRASKVIGIDIDKLKLEDAKIKYGLNSCLEFREGNIQSLEDKESYDAVTCFAVLHWLSKEDQAVAFRNVSRALKPGGVFITTFMIEPEKPRLNTAVQSIKARGERWKNVGGHNPIDVANPFYVKSLMDEYGLTTCRFERDESIISFGNDGEFLSWIKTWSTYKSLMNDEEHEEFWLDIIREYREITGQTATDKVNFIEYYLKLEAIRVDS